MYLPLKDRPIYYRSNLWGGEGDIEFTDLIPAAFMPPTARTLSVSRLTKGQSIGIHEHIEEGELYYIISGEAQAISDGVEYTLKAGDATWTTQAGDRHSIKNVKDEDCIVLFLDLRLPPDVLDPAWLKARRR